MCRKFICLVSLISVLSMAAGSANAYLVAYWPMDEGTGTTVGDVTGAWDGTITGNVTWVYGKEGMALEFPGVQNYVNCGNVEIGPDLTLAYWCFNPEKAFERSIGQHSANYTADPGWCVYSRNEGEGTVWFRVHGVDWWYGGDIIIPDILPKTEWYHLAFTFEGATRELKGYLDGELKVSNICEAGRSIHPNTNDLRMGYVGTGEPFSGMLDEVAVWNHVLTEDEILAVMEGYIGGANPNASRPVPADGALLSNTWVNLSWSPGGHAVSHDVYFGDNFGDVAAGTGDTFQGNQTETWFRVGPSRTNPYLSELVAGTTYYWRIDEVNDTEPDSPWKGDVWSFMTPPQTAYDPYPADGAEFFIDPNVTLSWTAGYGAKLHHVYFGDNFADVNDADKSDTTGIYRGAQETITYTPGPLGLDSLYYWRVDEDTAKRVEKTHKGDVWSFRTIQPIPITDPNLMCWWTFDETEGITAIDWSGHNHYGTVNGATWVANGQVGGALDFGGDGDHVIDEDAENYLNGLDALTVSMWIKSDVTNTDKGFINCEQPDGGGSVITMRYDRAGLKGGGTRVLKMVVRSTGGRQQLESSSNLQTTEWQHVAMTWSSGQELKFHVNGVLDSPTANDAGATGTLSNNVKLIIGKGSKDEGPSAGWAGMIDDVRIYNIALSDAEIYALGAPSNASAPSPADGATDVTQTPTLRWTAGGRAFQHDVYFGTDEEAVRNANMRSPEYEDTKDLGSESYDPGKLEWNTTYYWRVDEYNTDATISEGRVWSFSTRPPAAVIELTDATFDQIVLGSDVPVLVFFSAGWCPYSRMMDPIIQEIADEYAGTAKICELNVDDAPDIASRFGVTSVPRFILFKDGQVQREWRGVTSKKDLTDAIDELLGGNGSIGSIEGFETGDFSKFPWEHYGDETWAVTSRQKHSGAYSAEAGWIDHDQSTTLQVTLDCVSGNITFYRKVSSESKSDYLKFYIDGAEKGKWSGEEDWAQVSFGVTAGTRTFEWIYSKDGSESVGDDTAWIDDIRLYRGSAPPKPQQDSLEIVSTMPQTPAVLSLGEKLFVKVRYHFTSVEQARIWARPYTEGKRTPGYRAHPSPRYDAGSGVIEGWFYFEMPTKVDEVRVEMVPVDARQPIAVAAVMISAEWK